LSQIANSFFTCKYKVDKNIVIYYQKIVAWTIFLFCGTLRIGKLWGDNMDKQNLAILLVDDDFNERSGVRFLIEREKLPLTVLEASNGKRALEMIRDKSVDILFADIRMPYMDGMELSAIVHEEFPETKIIISSAYGEFEYAKKLWRPKL